tara:strand:- start:5138 stop:5437 length:300 start_codon:yes stop_codon:yes gene_type:complete
MYNTTTSSSNSVEANGSKKDSLDTKEIIFIISGVLSCIVFTTLVITWFVCKNNNSPIPIRGQTHITPAFENPMYNNLDLFQETLPTDPYGEGEDYIDVQ